MKGIVVEGSYIIVTCTLYIQHLNLSPSLSLFLSLPCSLPLPLVQHPQLPHHPGNQLVPASCDQLLEQTVDCVVGLSQQDFSSVISGLASLLQELIKVSQVWNVVQ